MVFRITKAEVSGASMSWDVAGRTVPLDVYHRDTHDGGVATAAAAQSRRPRGAEEAVEGARRDCNDGFEVFQRRNEFEGEGGRWDVSGVVVCLVVGGVIVGPPPWFAWLRHFPIVDVDIPHKVQQTTRALPFARRIRLVRTSPDPAILCAQLGCLRCHRGALRCVSSATSPPERACNPRATYPEPRSHIDPALDPGKTEDGEKMISQGARMALEPTTAVHDSTMQGKISEAGAHSTHFSEAAEAASTSSERYANKSRV